MKSLYMRFALTTICIMIVSGCIAFFLSNWYYQVKLKPYNDQKIAAITKNVKNFFQQHPRLDLSIYLRHVAALGFQLALFQEGKKPIFYGKPFDDTALSPSIVKNVLSGKTYHGVVTFPKGVFITGFFDDALANTIGVPLENRQRRAALFLRPDIGTQFGEMRIFFSVLLLLTIGLSILFVFIGTYYIVRPIRLLTKATQKIAEGDYHVTLPVQRTDELGVLSKNFSKMTASIEQLEEMRQQFVSNVSHEIQSPLTSIRGFAKTLQSNELSDEMRKQYLLIIEQESERLSLLSKQLLLLASLEKEENLLQYSSFDLAEQMKQVVKLLEWQWRSKGLTIELKLPSTSITADAKLLFQVWVNLLTNSVKFTEAGGTIRLGIISTSESIQVEMEDTGIGMKKEELTRIFDRFYKVDKSRNKKEEGSGLGLAIVQKIVHLHRGTIQVTSKLKEGTRFQMNLPRL
ncbi:HAMP domain-containing histidine kinase [Shimazuella sp. AN120528]|uniref:sensor histidine kinase n=1 Tax=Shimazuella soli TaxID=1892854 RepID=UPI001F1098D4|nr:HAMP domain-containing sensor histidine kinase [Shimazuella soli]MCH5586265.1 HAMP domain-containing histidine kinase [Shimazuella soli]